MFEWGAGDLIPNIDVPRMANGGVVSRPTLAMIGEAGPEAVVPLSRGGGVGSITINVNVAPTADRAAIGREIVHALQAASRADGGVGLLDAAGITATFVNQLVPTMVKPTRQTW